MSGLKRGSVAVVGAAESDLGQVAPHTSPVDLMAQATMRALDDCGLKLSDIDGIFSAATQVRTAPMNIAEYFRIKPKYFDGTAIGGSSFMTHVKHAQAAIEQGLCEVAVIAYGSTQRSVSRAAASSREFLYYETPYYNYAVVINYNVAPAIYPRGSAFFLHVHPAGTGPTADCVAIPQWKLVRLMRWLTPAAHPRILIGVA